MGITGLLPFLEKANASKPGNISQFSGGTVAIDSYCWLHKGAYCCSDKIAMGQPTTAYVTYCMKLVHMLVANKIKPILVFDGRHLPAKRETEVKRRENRETTRRRAAEMMRMGLTAEGRNLLKKSIDITHEMALELMKQCQKQNVDCIVAPYEADAQLAYLNISGIADVVITEDSDLTLFGCTKVFFKMDINGNGVLVEQNRLHLAMQVRADHFDIDKFRHMCILSGCDYLASLAGIGLAKAFKFVSKNTETDIHKALTRLPSYLNMKNTPVTTEYRDSFVRALITFKHQLVYCPLRRKQVRLDSPPVDVTEEQLRFAGEEVSEDIAWQLALGNYDPFTMKQLHNFDPDQPRQRGGKTNFWHEKRDNDRVSIWSKDFKVSGTTKENLKISDITKWPNTAGQVINLNTERIREKSMTPKKRDFGVLAQELSKNDVMELYGSKKLQKNDSTIDERRTPPPRTPSPSSHLQDEKSSSPILSRKSNPFAKPVKNVELSPSLVCRGKRHIKLKSFVGFRPTVIDDKIVQKSKYFGADVDRVEKIIIDENINGKIESTENSKQFYRESLIDDTSNSSGIFSSQRSIQLNLTPDREINDFTLTTRVEPSTSPISNYDNVDDIHNLLDDKCDIASQNSIGKLSFRIEDERNEKDDDDDEKNVSQSEEKVPHIRAAFFQWSNPKLNGDKSTTVTHKNLRQRKKIVTAKPPSTKKIVTKKNETANSQQSLLNMFGFQKKTVLRRSAISL